MSSGNGATLRAVGDVPKGPARQPRLRGRWEEPAATAARYVGAVSILVAGALHIEQYKYDYYSVVPTIGTLFLLNFIGATVVGLALLAPARRLGRNIGDLVHVLAALGAIAIAVPAIVFLLLSEYQPVFGLMEYGYRPVLVLVLVSEGLAAVSLVAFLILVARARRATSRSLASVRSPSALRDLIRGRSVVAGVLLREFGRRQLRDATLSGCADCSSSPGRSWRGLHSSRPSSASPRPGAGMVPRAGASSPMPRSRRSSRASASRVTASAASHRSH